MADIIDVKKKLNSLVRKSKPTAEGFSYICQLDGHQCVGRKTIIEYLKEKHEDMYNDLKAGFEDETEFRSQLSKMVMMVPYSNEEVNTTEDKVEDKEPEEEEIVEEKATNKNFPLTLDYMKTIDGRTTKIPNYGSLVGRIARLLALILRREKTEETGEIKIFSLKTDECIGGCQDIHSYIESTQPTFLENLISMFPPARKRMDQFVQRAAENFDLTVPTWQQVERLQKEESDRVAAVRKKEMEEKLQKAKAARAENEKKRKAELEQRLALKRKQDEDQKLKEFKQMKINPATEKAEEILKIKKEMKRIELAMKGKHVKENPKSKTFYKEKLGEQREKLKTILDNGREKRINKRLSDCLENLSPKQLRKLSMEYLNNIECVAEVNWADICQNVKIDDDFEYLADFLGCLYEMAKFHGKKGFKVGHVLVTSKQSEAIVEKGIRSVRDNISQAFIIPSSWDVDSPEEGLGQEWNRKADSRLLSGASRFGKNLLKIVNTDSILSLLALDSNGAVKEAVRRRFGHLINVYITRGQPAEEFGTSLYSIDREEEEEDDHHLEEKEEEAEEVVEVKDEGESAENKENQDNNGAQEAKLEEGQEEEKELVNLEDEDEIENASDPDEEIDEKLLDDSD